MRACFRDHLYAEFEAYKTDCIAANKSYKKLGPEVENERFEAAKGTLRYKLSVYLLSNEGL